MNSEGTSKLRVAVVGGGNMGTALARSFIEKGALLAQNLLILEASEQRAQQLRDSLPCTVIFNEGTGIDLSLLRTYDIVMFAVKPQDAAKTLEACASHISGTQLILSIMAGVSVSTISGHLAGHRKIVRCMPNMPVQVGSGVSVYAGTPAVRKTDYDRVKALLNTTGVSLQLDSEDLIDAATAISGSGPAYVYYCIEHLLRAAESLGLSSMEARILVANTFHGAIDLWKETRVEPEELRMRVTSKGGTTEAALAVLQKAGVGSSLEDAVHRAYQRSKELAKG